MSNASLPTDAENRISADVRCWRCRHLLRGITAAGCCPECGLSIPWAFARRWRAWTTRRILLLGIVLGAPILTLLLNIALVHPTDFFGMRVVDISSERAAVFFFTWLAAGPSFLVVLMLTLMRDRLPPLLRFAPLASLLVSVVGVAYNALALLLNFFVGFA